jgi:hypothetical protein
LIISSLFPLGISTLGSFNTGWLDQFGLNGIHASLLSDNDKTRLQAEFLAEFARLCKELTWA